MQTAGYFDPADGLQPGEPQYGLYQPTFGCFLLVVQNFQQAQQIKFLASSRYSLFAVDLSTAPNFPVGGLSNRDCELYAFQNLDQIDHKSNHYMESPLEAGMIMPAQVRDLGIDREKDYLQLVYHWVKYLYRVQERLSTRRIHTLIDEVLDVDVWDSDYEAMKKGHRQIRQILYLGDDTQQMHRQIQQVITDSIPEAYHLRDCLL